MHVRPVALMATCESRAESSSPSWEKSFELKIYREPGLETRPMIAGSSDENALRISKVGEVVVWLSVLRDPMLPLMTIL